jgi:hypothetical protein
LNYWRFYNLDRQTQNKLVGAPAIPGRSLYNPKATWDNQTCENVKKDGDSFEISDHDPAQASGAVQPEVRSKMIFIPYKNSLRLVILPEIESAYGFLEGIDTNIDRDEAELNRQHETQVIDERVLGGANNPIVEPLTPSTLSSWAIRQETTGLPTPNCTRLFSRYCVI